MKASQRDTSSSAAEDRRERERIREEKEMQRLMSAKGATVAPIASSSSTGFKSISLTPKPGFKKAETTMVSSGGGGGGWKTVGDPVKKSLAELSWGNNGEDEYDPIYPTPA